MGATRPAEQVPGNDTPVCAALEPGMAALNANTTAEQAAIRFGDYIKGSTVLVTGASLGGLGAEACRVLAQHSVGLLVLAGRSQEKLTALQDVIRKESPGTSTRLVVVDQNDLNSVRQAAVAVNAYDEPIDVLINGAGIMRTPYAMTKDGIESQFGVNYISHFLFTNLIRPSLEKSKSPRVVNISSNAHKSSDIRWDDIGFSEGEKYDKLLAYGQSKTANLLFTVELARRWKGVIAIAVHPGRVQTNIARHATPEEFEKFGITFDESGKWVASHGVTKTLSEGAATYIVASFDPELKHHSGSYMVDCQVANGAALPYALDPVSATKLWALSEEMVGQTFD